jgi:hypothetical protein
LSAAIAAGIAETQGETQPATRPSATPQAALPAAPPRGPATQPTVDGLTREQMAERLAAQFNLGHRPADPQPRIGPVSLTPGHELVPRAVWVIAAGQVARDQAPAGGTTPAANPGAGARPVPADLPPVVLGPPKAPTELIAGLAAAAARLRSGEPVRSDPGAVHVRATDIATARAYLAQADVEDAWAAKAVEVLSGNGSLTSSDEYALFSWLVRVPPDRAPRLAAFLLGRGRAPAGLLVGLIDPAHPDRSARAVELLRQMCARDPVVLAVDLPVMVARADPPPQLRGRAAYAIDQLTSGPDALPLPPGMVDAWTDMLLRDDQPNAAVAAEVLVRRGEHGLRDSDRATVSWVADLRSTSPLIRGRAIEALAEAGGDRPLPLTVRALGVALADADPLVRVAAARALERAGPRAAPAAVELAQAVRHVHQPPPMIPPRASTYLSLGRRAGPQPSGGEASVAITRATAMAAARALARIGPAADLEAVAILARGLSDPACRDDAAAALVGIGANAVSAVMEVYADANREGPAAAVATRLAAVTVVADVAVAGPAAEAALVQVLWSEPVPAVRAEACRGLARARHDPADARRMLAGELAAGTGEPALAAAEALARLGPGDDFDPTPVLPWLADGDRARRVAAARLLAAAGPRVADAAVGPLLRMADNVCGVQRAAAARALVAIDPDGRRLGPALLSAVYHRDDDMRRLLLPAVRRSVDPKVRGRLKDVADNDPDARVRTSAAEAITELAKM